MQLHIILELKVFNNFTNNFISLRESEVISVYCIFNISKENELKRKENSFNTYTIDTGRYGITHI